MQVSENAIAPSYQDVKTGQAQIRSADNVAGVLGESEVGVVMIDDKKIRMKPIIGIHDIQRMHYITVHILIRVPDVDLAVEGRARHRINGRRKDLSTSSAISLFHTRASLVQHSLPKQDARLRVDQC